MDVIQKVHFVVWMLVLISAAPLAATSGEKGDRLSPEAIMELVREGRDREAIDAYEALPEEARDSVQLLHTVADSYWRERKFESAYALYNEILKRQPTLQGLVPDDQPAGVGSVPVPVSLRVPAQESGDGIADEKGVSTIAALPVTETNAESMPAGLDAILAQLRREYLDIQTLARQREIQLQARLEALQSDTGSALNALKSQHQEREQALGAQVSSLEQTVEAMRVEFEKERAVLQAQVDLLTHNVIPPGKDGEPLPRRMVMAGYYRDQQDHAAASELYKQVLKENPDDVAAKRKLITTLFDMQRYEDALDYLADEKRAVNEQ